MGGSSNPLKRIAQAINPIAAIGGKIARKGAEKTGVTEFIPSEIVGAATGDISSGVEGLQKVKAKSKLEKTESKRIARESAEASQKAISDIKKRRTQEAASVEAGKSLIKSRSRQQKGSKGTGRRSTILTGNLGGVEGSQGRKTLLGL